MVRRKEVTYHRCYHELEAVASVNPEVAMLEVAETPSRSKAEQLL
jgi:hypothetical protein